MATVSRSWIPPSRRPRVLLQDPQDRRDSRRAALRRLSGINAGAASLEGVARDSVAKCANVRTRWLRGRSRMSSRPGDPALAHSSLWSLKVGTAFPWVGARRSIFTALRGGFGCGSTRRSSIATPIQSSSAGATAGSRRNPVSPTTNSAACLQAGGSGQTASSRLTRPPTCPDELANRQRPELSPLVRSRCPVGRPGALDCRQVASTRPWWRDGALTRRAALDLDQPRGAALDGRSHR